ncbi:MAG: SAM-dependent methyltransferase, partial [Lachnospiraceae bacterium]
IGEAVDFVSVDVAFISLTKVLEPVYHLMKNGARIVCLIKPQFEAGREKVGKKGVVRERETHLEVIEQVIRYGDSLGFLMLGLDYSPIRGPEGNIEYLLYMEKREKASAEAAAKDKETQAPLSKEAEELLATADCITKKAHEALEK